MLLFLRKNKALCTIEVHRALFLHVFKVTSSYSKNIGIYVVF